MGKKQTGGFSEAKSRGLQDEVQRGTQDELEILAMVIIELPSVKMQVLDRLREVRERSMKAGKLDGVPRSRKPE